MSQPIEAHDGLTHFWCPMLGQPLQFGYCRRAQEGLPCSRVTTCFAGRLDVEAFLEAHYTPEERARFLAPPPSRLQRVADALAQANQPSAAGEDEDQ
ncbi:MAG: hypothetical protein HY910_11695 [Desulfarculus sp.]|nr:hypothetical protein [Desulfarculus sp.]